MTPEVVLPSMHTSTHMRVHPHTNIHKYARTKGEWVFQNIAKIFFILSFYLCFRLIMIDAFVQSIVLQSIVFISYLILKLSLCG